MNSDAGLDPQAYVLTPESVITIAQAVVSAPTPPESGKAAALTAIRLLRDAQKDGCLRIHPRELPWLDRMQKAVEAIPASEAEFIGEMMCRWTRPSLWRRITGWADLAGPAGERGRAVR